MTSCGWVENAGGYPGSWDDDGQGGQHQSIGWIASIGNAFCILQYPKSGTVWNVRLAYADVPGWRTGKVSQ